MNIKNMYKKSLKATALIAVVAILAVFALLGAACNNSEKVTDGTFEYALLKGGDAYEITALGNTKDLNVTVPSRFDGKPVTRIGDGAFSNAGIKSVTIPDSVFSIGEYAFNDCGSLIEITLPQALTELPDGIFLMCDALKTVLLPDGITRIGTSAFQGCSSLESMIIPLKTVFIGETAFAHCRALDSLVFTDASGWTSGGEDIPEETLTDPHAAAVYAENVANAMIKIFDHDDADMLS